jgi:hypothetical protein
MPRKGHTEEQIVYALRQVEACKKVADVCREVGVFQAGFLQLEATLRRSRVERAAGTARQLREETPS